MPNPEPPPVSPITVRIEINAEEWEYVRRRLRHLSGEADERDQSNFAMYGGGAGGAYHVTTTTRDVSTEQYRAELEAWCAECRASRAVRVDKESVHD